LVEQHVLEHDCGEASYVEEYVEPGQALAEVLLVEHLPLVKLGTPHEDEETRLEGETADEEPEGWQTEVLHKLSLALDGELEVNGEEEKVPDEVDSDGNGRETLRQGMILSYLFNYAQHREEGQNNNHSGHERVVRDVRHIVGQAG